MEPHTSTLSNNPKALEEFFAKFPPTGTIPETYTALCSYTGGAAELCVYSPYNGTFAIVSFENGIATAKVWQHEFLVPIMEPMTPRWINNADTPEQLKNIFNKYFLKTEEIPSTRHRYYVAPEVNTVMELAKV